MLKLFGSAFADWPREYSTSSEQASQDFKQTILPCMRNEICEFRLAESGPLSSGISRLAIFCLAQPVTH